MFTDILGIALTMAGGYTALMAWDKTSPVIAAIAFSLLVGAAMTIWAGGIEMAAILPPDDWDEIDDDTRL